MTIEFRNTKNEFIKQWPNWTGIIPMKDDHVLLHFGDNNEVTQEYIVTERGISGTEPDKVFVIVYEFDVR